MHADFDATGTMRSPSATAPRSPARPRSRRSTGERLEEALITLSGGLGKVTIHREMPWASVTFSGTRHRVTLCYTGQSEVEAGEFMLAEVEEHEFRIPGQLVADAQVVRVGHELIPDAKLRVELELLLLED